MPVETAADLETFFDAGDFGVEAHLTTAGGEYDLSGLFDQPFQGVAEFEGVEAADTAPTFRVAAKDWPAGAKIGDRLTIGAVVWAVASPEPEGDGATLTIRLKAAI